MKTRRIVLALIIALIITAVPVMASEKMYPGCTFEEMVAKRPKNGMYRDKYGFYRIYKHGKLLTGDIKYNGRYYYAHKTGTKKYPKGTLTCEEIRIRDGKWYAYDIDGEMFVKDRYVRTGRFKRSKVLDIDERTMSVINIYNYSKQFKQHGRYNVRLRKWQFERTFDDWYTPKQKKSIPKEWIDYQK